MNTFYDSLQAIHARIAQAKAQVGRNDTVQLCAVSKAQSAEKIRLAYEAGQTIFGENYVQEALTKQAELQDCNIEWHFIGPIQSNKTQLIAQHFVWVHSVDRIKIAERLAKARPDGMAPLNVCIQINSSEEASKSGASMDDVMALASSVSALPSLKLRGVMAIPAPTQDKTLQHQQFKQVHNAFMALQQAGYAVDTLSIGMSDDFEAAIAEGATIVRIGSAIFGTRPTPKHSSESIWTMQGNASFKLGFVGGGNMATAMIVGLKQQQFDPQSIQVIELDAEKRATLESTFGVKTSDQLEDVTHNDVIILAVKPQQLKALASSLAPLLKQQLIISIAAGIRIEDLSRWLGNYASVVRAMPNTPAQIQAGVTGVYASPDVSSSQKQQATEVLDAIGETVWLSREEELDAVTAISGSGPAYVFYLIEALQEAAIQLGLSEAQAKQLSIATFQGASQLAANSSTPVQTLRAQVTSKGGTTEQGILSLETSQVKQAIVLAAQQAEKRAKIMGDELGKS